MPPKHRAEMNRYCQPCKATTKHVEGETTTVCQRCGSIKHHRRTIPRAEPVTTEDRIAEALGLLESADSPKAYKPEGEQKKSAEGAHRPDKGTKFVQLPYDDQFEHKDDYFTIHH